MLVTMGGALKSRAHICPTQLDAEARGEAVTLAVQRTGTLPQPGDPGRGPELQTSFKAPSDPSGKQQLCKQPTTHFRRATGVWGCGNVRQEVN